MTYVKSKVVKTKKGKVVTYIDEKGNSEVRSGGTASWRNSNPGNIIQGKWANRHSAIGGDGHFAVFPDEQVGRSAKRQLLQTKYINYESVRQVLKGKFDAKGNYIKGTAYAPKCDHNDPDKYADDIKKWTGLDVDNKKLRDFTPEEWDKLLNAMKRKEGWKVGTITSDHQTPAQKAISTPGYGAVMRKTVDRISSPANDCIYIVKPSDSLTKISKIHKVSIGQIVAVNPAITHIDQIFVGQKLIIPTSKNNYVSSYHNTRHSKARKPKIGVVDKQPWWGEDWFRRLYKRWF